MRTYSTYFDSIEEFKTFVHTHGIEDNDRLLIQVFTSLDDIRQVRTLRNAIVALFPNAALIGASTDGEIASGRVSIGKTVVSLTQFTATSLSTTLVDGYTSSLNLGRHLAHQLPRHDDDRLLITFTDGLHCNGEDYVLGISDVRRGLTIAGGLAGDGARFARTFVFTRDRFTTRGAAGVLLSNPALKIHTDYTFNWTPVGKFMTVTRVEGNRLYTLDDQPVVSMYARYFGEELANKLPEIGLEFPLIIQRGDYRIARAALARHDDGSLTFAGNFLPGDQVRFGYGDAEMILNRSFDTYGALSDRPIESIFVYSCMARRRFMPNLIGEEIRPLQSMAETSGFFTYGEFYSCHDRSMLMNQTTTLVALSETDAPASRPHLEKTLQSFPLKDYQRSIKALSHLVNVTTEELRTENEHLEEKNRILQKMALDITEQLQLKALNHELVSIIENSLNEIYIIERETYRYLYANQTALDRLGYTREELLQMTVFDINRSLSLEEARAIEKRVLANGTTSNRSVHTTKGGETYMVETIIEHRWYQDKEVGVIFGIDISQQVEAEHYLKRQAEILEQIHDSVVSTDLDGIITSWNHGAKTIHGYTAEEMIGRPIDTLYFEEDVPLLRHMEEETLRHGMFQGEIRKRTKSGTKIDTLLTLTLLRDDDEVVGLTRFTQDITQKKKIERKLQEQQELLQHQAHYDVLTGLPNRILLDDRLQQSLHYAKRHDEILALFFIDLDNFKQINDTHGHVIGDKVLKIAANRLQEIIRKEDTLARFGGDEFILLTRSLVSPQSAAIIAQKVIDVFRPKITVDGLDLHIGASIGISFYPKDSSDKNDLLKYADVAMYEAKKDGKNRYKFYEGL